jgi:tetratricopeptide (TPR) repeat protein
MYRASGELKLATEATQTALAILEKLTRAHPRLAEYQKRLVHYQINLCLLYDRAGQTAQTAEACNQALAWYDRLAREHPQIIAFAGELGSRCLQMGSLLDRLRRPEDALHWYERALRTLEALPPAQRQRSEAQVSLRTAYAGQAVALYRLSRSAEALQAWNRAIAVKQDEVADQLRLARAHAVARSGDHARATDEVNRLVRDQADGLAFYNAASVHALAAAVVLQDDKLQQAEREQRAEEYAARAVGLLTQARAVGYFNDPAGMAILKGDQHLDPLRSRADFQNLLSELAARKGSTDK